MHIDYRCWAAGHAPRVLDGHDSWDAAALYALTEMWGAIPMRIDTAAQATVYVHVQATGGLGDPIRTYTFAVEPVRSVRIIDGADNPHMVGAIFVKTGGEPRANEKSIEQNTNLLHVLCTLGLRAVDVTRTSKYTATVILRKGTSDAMMSVYVIAPDSARTAESIDAALLRDTLRQAQSMEGVWIC